MLFLNLGSLLNPPQNACYVDLSVMAIPYFRTVAVR